MTANAIETEAFTAAMSALAQLSGRRLTKFFDDVTVNDEDPDKRESARLALIARFRDAVHQVADFSRIEG